jgi:hypothetical protein
MASSEFHSGGIVFSFKRKAGGALRFACVVSILVFASLVSMAQEAVPVSTFEWPFGPNAVSETKKSDSPAKEDKKFRVEKTSVAGGSELITIFANVNGFNASESEEPLGELPLVSFLRDTLGDDIPENDRLRYFWLLSRGDPSFARKAAASVPFLFTRVGNKGNAGTSPPKPLADINPVNQKLWDQVFFTVFKKLVIEDMAKTIKMPFYQYRKNAKDYRISSVSQALSLLAIYQALEGDSVLSAEEMSEIRSRLIVSDSTFASFIDRNNFARLDQASLQRKEGIRGINWDLLRQRCEAEGLYFDPLEMPDGGTSHVLVWVDEEDLKKKSGGTFNSRLLNIKSPWTDPRLLKWQGYSEIRWYDEENRLVPAGTPNARKRRMIPLALYGLDFPKIPVLLVDFRTNWNPKRREMSRRILDDLTRNVLSVSAFNNPAILVGRFLADFVVRRRGIDINQDSRVTSYAKLKLLILLNESLDPEFKTEISGRVEAVSLNPLQNDAEVEVRLAKQQYRNLMAYAADPKGLPAKIAKDRTREMISLKHNGTEKFFFSLGRIFSLGFYEHREKWTPELAARLDNKRQLEFHESNLQVIARDSIDVEIDADENSVKRSLAFVSESGLEATKKTIASISSIFTKTKNQEIRDLSLLALYRINTPSALREILALYNNESLAPAWRKGCAGYLELAASGNSKISPDLSKEILSALDD